MKTTKETELIQHTRIQLTGKDIIRLLVAAKRIKATKETVVNFHVPTGGDWSGSIIEIDSEHPIIVSAKSYDRKKPS